MPRNKKQKLATDDEVEFKAKLVVHNPCCALNGEDVQCSNHASDMYTCRGSGYGFCRSHRWCVQPASITSYLRLEQARALAKAWLLSKGVPEPMVDRVFELAGEIPAPVDAEAVEWSGHYVRRICGPQGLASS